jgi:ribonuclease HII
MVISDESAPAYRIGADENGLGSRLGPMITTAVLARVEGRGHRLLGRKLPPRLAADLADSKAVVSHADARLGEAWARVLAAPSGGGEARSPAEVFQRLSLEGENALREPCPRHVERQCWSTEGEAFGADDAMVERLRGHRDWLAERGVGVLRARVSVACTRHLNDEKAAGRSRFVVDLHAMERLVLALREVAGHEVEAVCGKVGGIGDYSRFFGPLGGRLHARLEQGRQRSGYHFPGLGQLYFVMDADASDPLVMLASLVGKYVRELLMARVARFYRGAQDAAEASPSGYHDPRTARFFVATEALRQRRRVPLTCFERARDGER